MQNGKVVINYGTSIASNYDKIYFVENGVRTEIENPNYPTWRGNYYGANTMGSNIINSGTIITTPSSKSSRYYSQVVSETNTFNFINTQSNKLIFLYWRWGGGSGVKTLSNIVLLFNNGQSFNVQGAVSNKYIEPLVTYIDFDTGRINRPYILDNPEQLIIGGSQTKSYSAFLLCFKVKTLSTLNGVSFYTDVEWNISYNDGFKAYSNDNIEFTL